MKIGKVWGETKPWLVTPLVEIHRVSAKKDSWSSKHYHEHKWNAFYVISGILEITVFKDEYELEDVTELGPDEMTTVKPGEWHLFRAVEDCKFLEIYYLEPLKEDIIRDGVGGSG